MVQQNEITRKTPVLDAKGRLTQCGYSRRSVMEYNRKNITAPPWRIKEWDFYQVSNNDFCLQFTIGHVSYVGMITLTFFEFATGKRIDVSDAVILPFGSMKMPASADFGDLTHKGKKLEMSFTHSDKQRRLRCVSRGTAEPALDIDITLSQPDDAAVVMAIPFDDKDNFFYYNHKINCMPADGYAVIGDKRYEISSSDAFGLLDWGRGVWPFHQEWFWGNGSAWVDGKRFGFNIGYGFGNTSAATENTLFYDGTVHKISNVMFDLRKDGYMSKKRFTSDDGRFEMEFTPVYDRYTETKLLFVDNNCHQLFGRFNGTATLDDGKVLQIKDLMAFTEVAVNNW